MSESLSLVEWLARYDQAARPAVCPTGDPHAHDIDGKLINATVRCIHGYSTNLEMPPLDVEQLRAALKELEQLRAASEVVWLTKDNECNFGVWRDPDYARQQIIQDWFVETPGDYEWVNDADRTHEVLLCDGEVTGVTLWMALVADADLEACDANGGEGR